MSSLPDGQLQMSGNDARLLVVPGSITSQLEDLGCQVFHHSGHVDGGARAHPLGVVAFPEELGLCKAKTCAKIIIASHLRSLWILPTGN